MGRVSLPELLVPEIELFAYNSNLAQGRPPRDVDRVWCLKGRFGYLGLAEQPVHVMYVPLACTAREMAMANHHDDLILNFLLSS